MGGAASKDFIENGSRTAVVQELDELGGYDRPALAKNQSFTARLDWLGTQVGKTSDQMQAALFKDEQAGRKELEKEAKRRQLMALRRGQGDIQMNLQYADFYLKHKQYERGGLSSSASILRNSAATILAAAEAEVAAEARDPGSPKGGGCGEAARRSQEHVATLQRLYSSKGGPASHGLRPLEVSAGAASEPDGGGSKPTTPGGRNKWRQRVQQAKKTAFLAVGTYIAMNVKNRGPARIDDLGLFAEQQLGEGVQKFIEEGEKLAVAREKLPEMKAELETLRTEMRTLTVETQAAEATAGDCDDEADDAATLESAGILVQEPSEEDGAGESAAATATAATAAMRHPRQKAAVPNNKPRWHFSGGPADTFGNPYGPPKPVVVSKPPPRLRDPPAAPATTSSTGPHASSHLWNVSSTSVSAPLPTFATRPGTAGISSSHATVTSARRRNPPHLLTTSLNGAPPGALTAPVGPGGTHGSVPGLGVAGPGLTRAGQARASWSGGVGSGFGVEPGTLGFPGAPVTGAPVTVNGVGDVLALPQSQQPGSGALRPSRPSAPGILRAAPGQVGPVPSAVAAAAAAAIRSRSENASPAGHPTSATAAQVVLAAVAGRPPSPGRPAPFGPPRPPSASGAAATPRPGMPRPGEPPRINPDAPTTPGQHRIGTMALRIASRIALPTRAAARHQLRALRDAETANVLRQQQLVQAIEENSNIQQTSSGLLNMYCNRANGRWVEQQQWALPHVHELALPAVKRLAERYRELVLRDLKEGRLAVMIHVDDDILLSARMGPIPLWSVDPWQFLAVTHPARTEWTSHLIGLGMGVRQLLALATAVEGLAGPEGVSKMQVVISCHEGQVDAVARDLAARRLCRFNPDNVVISVQQRAHGHVYDREKHCFVSVPGAPLRAAGSGYALLALCWEGPDTFRLGGPELTERRPVDKSVLDTYMEKGVTWLSSWRLRDLIHYSPDTCLNVEQMALSYAFADSVDANMSMQVNLMEAVQGISRCGSGIVLALKERGGPPPPTAASSNVTILNRRTGTTNGTTKPSPHSPPQQQPTPPSTPPPAQAAHGETGASKPPSPPSSTRTHPGQAPASVQIPQRHPVSAPPSPANQSAGAGGRGSGGGAGSGPGRPPSPRAAPASATPLGGGTGGSRRSLPSGGPRAGGIGSEGGPLPACDIKWADVQTPALAAGLQQLVDSTAMLTGTQPRVAVSIKRYMYQVESLKAILTGPSIFRPSVSVHEGGYLYVTFDASDITVLPNARCVAMSYTPRTSDTPGGGGSAAGGEGPTGPPNTHLPPVQGWTGGGGGGAATGPLTPRVTFAGPNSPSAGGSATGAVAAATAAAAAAAMQRGRLLTNDADLDTLLWVLGDQDSHAAFRASVSATNTARLRVTSHAAGGVAGVTGALAIGGIGSRSGGSHPQQNVIVVAVTDDAACPLAVRMAMAIMKPGADCLHVLTIAKDVSAMAVSAAKAVAERFEIMASATLGDVKSVVQVKRLSIVEDIAAYAESVRAVLLITGSISLSVSAAQGSSVVGSVALSLARDCGRPMLVVKPNCRLAETAYEVGKKPCLRAALCAETSSRPMVRFVADNVLDGSRGDKVVLVKGRAFDKDMNELTSSRRILDHLAEEAINNRRFDSSGVVRRMVPGSFEGEVQRVADADQCQIVGVMVPECRVPLPSTVTQMLRTSRAAVLVYRTTVGRPSPNSAVTLEPESSSTSP